MGKIKQVLSALKGGLTRLLIPHKRGRLFVWQETRRIRRRHAYNRTLSPLPNITPMASLPQGIYTELLPAEPVTDRRPAGLPEWAVGGFAEKTRRDTGPYGAVRLADTRLHGDGLTEELMVEMADGNFLGDIWHESVPVTDEVWLSRKPRSDVQPRRLGGTAVVLAHAWADNYYHFRLQCLPRISLALRLVEQDQVSHWIVPVPQSGFQRRLLEAAGIPERKRVMPQPGQVILAEDLLVPSVPCEDRYVPEWAWRYSASLITPDEAFPKHEKVYIRRGSGRGRHLINEAQVMALLERQGFVCLGMDGLPLEQQAAVFQNARVIVGVHGAALTNLIHARPGTTLVEIMPANWIEPCFQRLSTSLGLEHRVVVGLEPHRPGQDYFQIPLADTKVSLADLQKSL